MLKGMADPGEHLRAADADRQAVADQLRAALDEGRLDFHEYDTRLRDAYAAKTYGELNRLLADLPAAQRQQLVPTGGAVPATTSAGGPPFPDATRRWLLATWDDYVGAVTICVAIWVTIALTGGGWQGFWPAWVAGPWGAYLVYETVRGLATGEPQRWAAKQDRKRAAKAEKRARKASDDAAEEPGASEA